LAGNHEKVVELLCKLLAQVHFWKDINQFYKYYYLFFLVFKIELINNISTRNIKF
jgi:hypothetical protein